jgi:hypothetical protein
MYEKNKHSTSRNNHERAKQEKKSSGMLRLFSVIMLLLMAVSSLGRVAAASHSPSRSGQTPGQQSTIASSEGTAARVLVFHREDRGSSLCEDLVITAAGDAVYSTCVNGMEKQYTLSATERQQLQAWIKSFKAVNYDHNDITRVGDTRTQLYFNGQGNQLATDAETHRMIDFATALEAKIATQS